MNFFAQTRQALFQFKCTGYRDVAGEPFCSLTDLLVFARQLINLIFYLAPLLAGLVIIWGAFLIITSRGTEQLNQGRNVVFKGLLGLVIVFGAWAIVNTVFQLLGVNCPWYQLRC